MSKFELPDKIAIITGGAGSMGTCIALEFAKAGANVVVADLEAKQEGLDENAAKIKSLGRESLAIATDVCVPEQVDNMVKQTVDKFGRVDILVNTAGGALPFLKMEDLPFEDWNAVITLNLTGTFLPCVAAGKVMIEQKSGKIINISSLAGIGASPIMIHYGAAKAGVINLTKSLAVGWAKHNINVNCIAPGPVATEGAKLLGFLPPDKNEDGTPVPRLQFAPGPEDIADLALFFASAASDHISGEVMPIKALAR